MKKILFATLIVLHAPHGYPQEKGETLLPEISAYCFTDINEYKAIDTAIYEISYSLKYLSNVNTKQAKVIEDVCVLQIGKRLSKTYSKAIYDQDSAIIEYKKKHPGAEGIPGLQKAVPPVEIFKGLPAKNKCTEMRVLWGALMPPILKYSEDTPVFDWAITDKKKDIQGYSCTMATMRWRGRDYEAWFAPDIPLNEGPWKFGGLPGLIMAIKDSKGHYVFECVGIRQEKDKTIPIKYFNKQYDECTREKFYSTLKNMYARPQQWLQNQGAKGIRMRGETGYNSNFVSIYNPLELE